MSIFNTKPYLAAISGGPDSIALLNMYHRHIKVVCTVNYHKRVNSNYDVECVKKICDKYKISLEVLDVNDEIYKKYENISNFQTQARLIRYDFFVEVAKKYNIKKILIAHHLDDFLETGYINLQKQSKSLFYGIREYSQYNDLLIYRPFINKYRKTTLQRYCDDLDLIYAIDESNEDDKYERNKVRKTISKMSNDQVYDLLKKIKNYNKEHKKELIKIEKFFFEWKLSLFDIKLFKSFTTDEQYYLIYEFLKYHNFPRSNKNKILGIISFINGMNGKEYRLDDNKKLIKQDNCLKVK